ncbi:hypothetical protein RB199_26490 [Streptomyces libani]
MENLVKIRPQMYSPQEFLNNLASDNLQATLTLTGMIKNEEDGDKFASFAIGTRCANWRKIPIGAIESIEHLGSISCEEHTHPLVNISFKAPQSDEALLFASFAADMKGEAHRIITKVLSEFGDSSPSEDSPAGCRRCLNFCGTVTMDEFFSCYAFCLDAMC